jgi:hypothetical protein
MLELVRFPDWSRRLHQAILERRRRPHQWGQFDCALCGAELVDAITGVNFGAPFRGTYDSPETARAVLEANGWPEIGAMVSAFLPERFERPRRGDVVLGDGEFGPFIAVVADPGYMAGPTRYGLRLTPLRHAARAWSVGDG